MPDGAALSLPPLLISLATLVPSNGPFEPEGGAMYDYLIDQIREALGRRGGVMNTHAISDS